MGGVYRNILETQTKRPLAVQGSNGQGCVAIECGSLYLLFLSKNNK